MIRFVSFSVFVHLSISLSTYFFCLYNALRDVPCKLRDLMYSLLSIAFPLSIVEEPTQSIHKLGGILVIQGFILKTPISRVYSQMQLVSAHRRSVLRWGDHGISQASIYQCKYTKMKEFKSCFRFETYLYSGSTLINYTIMFGRSCKFDLFIVHCLGWSSTPVCRSFRARGYSIHPRLCTSWGYSNDISRPKAN